MSFIRFVLKYLVFVNAIVNGYCFFYITFPLVCYCYIEILYLYPITFLTRDYREKICIQAEYPMAHLSRCGGCLLRGSLFSSHTSTMAYPLADSYFVSCTNPSSRPLQALVIGEVIWAM